MCPQLVQLCAAHVCVYRLFCGMVPLTAHVCPVLAVHAHQACVLVFSRCAGVGCCLGRACWQMPWQVWLLGAAGCLAGLTMTPFFDGRARFHDIAYVGVGSVTAAGVRISSLE